MNLVADDLLRLDEFPLFQVRNDLGVWVGACLLYNLELFSGCVLDRIRLCFIRSPYIFSLN